MASTDGCTIPIEAMGTFDDRSYIPQHGGSSGFKPRYIERHDRHAMRSLIQPGSFRR